METRADLGTDNDTSRSSPHIIYAVFATGLSEQSRDVKYIAVFIRSFLAIRNNF